MVRIIAALFILATAGSIVLLDMRRADGADGADPPLAINAEPVPIDFTAPDRERIGALRFLGGWALTSEDPDFGGISALALTDAGFVAIGDAGGLFRFVLSPDGRITRAEVGALPDGPRRDGDGGSEAEKRDRDAESAAFDSRTGRFWIGFEGADAVWRYNAALTAAEANRDLPLARSWPNNGGAEALVRLPDGRFLIFSEAGDGPADSREALLFAGDPSEPGPDPIRFGYRPPDDHRITDAALLPDGRLIILNRRFTMLEGVSVVVTIAALDAIAEGAILEGREIARFAPPLTIDNMEAIVVERDGDRTIVWMASDDNFNPLQRTLLLKFELVDFD